MIFNVITLFQDALVPITNSSILKRAQNKNLIKLNLINPRDFAKDKRKTVDDTPYGGGRGMIMKVDVLVSAIESIKTKNKTPKSKPYTILLSASGRRYNQNIAKELSLKKELTLICGHYEGVDARVENFVDDVISIGDFVLTGGEIAALTIIDSVTRLIPGAIHQDSTKEESFSIREAQKNIAGHLPSAQLTQNRNGRLANILEYPQYTRPTEFRNLKVPKILVSGNHAQIAGWKKKESMKRTKKYRPDLLQTPK